jgi:hypothetical protein
MTFRFKTLVAKQATGSGRLKVLPAYRANVLPNPLEDKDEN